MISEKSIILCYGIHVSSSWWVLALIYTFMCTCDFYRYEHIILQKEGISKHSGKQENFAIGLDSCYLFNLEHGTEHEIDRAYGVCMHLTFLNFTTDEFDSLVVCNIINVFL